MLLLVLLHAPTLEITNGHLERKEKQERNKKKGRTEKKEE